MKKLFFLALGFLRILNAIDCDDQFVLITSLYNETNPQRIQEYIVCLERNIAHPLIKKIHIFYDTDGQTDSNPILEYIKKNDVEIRYISGRPSFAACFALANERYPDQKIIVSNADIYFNETLKTLAKYDLKGKFLALTRWNVQANGAVEIFRQFDYLGNFSKHCSERSQDVWMFSTPINISEADDIFVGTWYCDGRIAYRAYEAKLAVQNPCLTIQCCHLHLSGIRNYPITRTQNYITAPAPWCVLKQATKKSVKN